MHMRNLTVLFKNGNANRSVQNGTEWNGMDWLRLHYTTEQFWKGRNGYFWLVETGISGVSHGSVNNLVIHYMSVNTCLLY